MGSVSNLFHPERWVSQWRALGGYLTVGEWPVIDGEPTLLDLAPTFPAAEPWDSPRRRQATHLRAALAMPGARGRVIDYLARVEASRGWG
ncbi:hypothetical protein [Novosphingobium sp. Gsoil 351]|uniref:hypothetical protein n=1 Tax=Novosphingobium sp. Gsoil 351 TaxID=2675225 RepID=UPI0012B48B41|nr:hypothetical protein [Novosphingobium sp. Gsoil 351]QGN54628.1 hypothetical protein GKE62_08730 [Novosphingobium sp. Gsoil 351]